jgi:outer membrane protein OmpA-like peptidoglycan-associated protein
MKPLHTLCLVSAALLALSGVQPSKAADADRSIVVAQRTTLGGTNEAAEQAKQKALERSQQAADKAKAKSKAEAKKRADAKRKAEERAKAKAEAQRKAEEKAKATAEAEARKQADAKRKAEERAKAKAEARRKAQEKARDRAEAKRKAEESAKARADERDKARAEAERKAEERAKARAEAKQKEKAEADAKRKARERAKAEAEAQRKADEKAKAAAEQEQQEQERQRSGRDERRRDGRDRDRARRDGQRAPEQEGSDSRVRLGAPPPPTKPRDANDFIRRNRNTPERNLTDLRRERRETREGNRRVIQEGDRTIVREGRRSFIRHNESDRFAVGARDVRVNRRGGETTTIVVRPNGVQIISVTDRDGDLIRRVRRDSNGREIVLINNRFAGRRDRGRHVDVRRPRRERHRRHIVEAHRASLEDILWALTAVPIATLDRRYTLEQVRYSDPLRDYMPRVDLDIHFDSGSWQLTPDQIDKLSVIARGLNRAIDRDPRELYMVEGYTDAVGDPIDNLSLSDRRAEAVAVALTEGFGVPPENLVTQGYGEDYLKVPTPGPSRVNRRVAIRRITPLVAEVDRR